MNEEYIDASTAIELERQLKEIRSVVGSILDKKAKERLSNLRVVKPEMVTELEIYLYQLYKAGQIKQITDEQLVAILSELNRKKEIKVKRR